MHKIIRALIFLSIILSSICYSQNLSGIKIGIVHSEFTKQLIYPKDNTFYPIQDWEFFFLNRKISYKVISDDDLESNDLDDIDVLILPSVEVLSQKSIANLGNFLNSGKGLFVIGKLGEYNELGRKSDSKFLLNYAGFGYTDLVINNKISAVHTLNSPSVICKGLKYDNGLLILNSSAPLVAESISSNVKSIGYYNLNESSTRNENGSGIVFSEKGNGKVVWFGFRLSQIGNKKSAGSIVEKLIFNSIEWLSQIPVVMIKLWPGNYKLPVLFVNTLIDKKLFSPEALGKFKIENSQSNFFIDSDILINADDELINKLSPLGELNLLSNLNSTDDSLVGSKLDRIYNKLRKNNYRNFYGIKLSNIYSDNLPDEIVTSQFNFFETANNKILLKLPAKAGEKSLIELPLRIISQFVQGKDEQSILKSISLLKDAAINNEKLLVLNFINQKRTGRNLEVLSYLQTVGRYLQKENAWITTYSKLIKWVLNSENLIVSTRKLNEKNKFEIKIENRNQNELKDIVLLLFPPAGKLNPELSQSKIKLEYNREAEAYNIAIPFIKAGTHEIIIVQFRETNISPE